MFKVQFNCLRQKIENFLLFFQRKFSAKINKNQSPCRVSLCYEQNRCTEWILHYLYKIIKKKQDIKLCIHDQTCHTNRCSILNNSSDSFDFKDFTERDAVDDAIETGDTKAALQLIKEKAKNYQKRFLRHVFR